MKNNHFWLGLVSGALIAALVLFSIYYVPRRGITFSKDPMHFTLALDAAHGLNVGSPVYIAGIEAGEVDNVGIRALDAEQYRVFVSVTVFDRGRFGPLLRTGSIYQVGQNGLLGESTLNIVPGGGGSEVENQVVDGLPPTDINAITQDIAHVTQRLADFMDGRQAGDPNLRRALKDLQSTILNIRDFSEKLPK